jgi:hypothetical protein
MSKKKIAFWSYDLFPYYLWGETNGKVDKDGMVYIDSYQGSVKPAFILSNSAGKVLADQLLKLKQEKRDLGDRYDDLAKIIINRFTCA